MSARHQFKLGFHKQSASGDDRRFAEVKPPPVCQVYDLGLVNYPDGLDLQAALVQVRKAGQIPDTLLLLQHPPTITMGRRANPEDVVADAPTLVAHGIEIYPTNRGGQVTYHGPGQLVCYPILDLRPDRCDAHRYLRDLEEVVIRTLADFGIEARRITGLTGVWVGQEKIAAIGVHLSNWVTSHGFALNAQTDLNPFNYIVPCGLTKSHYGVTSIQKLLKRQVSILDIQQRLVHQFETVFDRNVMSVQLHQGSVQVIVMAVHSPEPEVLLLKRTLARGDFWQPVTGMIEPDETPVEAATRELQEETGLSGQPISMDLIQSFFMNPSLSKQPSEQPQINREYSFLVKTRKKPPRLNPEEHSAACWLSWQRALTLVKWNSARWGLIQAARLAAGQADS